jgi:alpha-galactosidase
MLGDQALTRMPPWCEGAAVLAASAPLSGMAAGVGGSLLDWTEEELREATDLIGQYKQIRPIVQHGRQYRLGTHAGRTAVQYGTPDQIVVLAWQLPLRAGLPTIPVRLRNLDPAARYRDEDTGAVHHGAVLMAHGIDPGLHTDYSSALIRLTGLP